MALTLTLTSQAVFTALLAKEGKVLLFYLHGMGQQTKQMVEATDSLQTNFDSQKPEGVLVVPVDWGCDDGGGWMAQALKHVPASVPGAGKLASLAGTALNIGKTSQTRSSPEAPSGSSSPASRRRWGASQR